MKDDTTDTTDIFLWANNTDGVKKELDVEFFLFNKNYTPYSTSFSSDLNAQIKPLFLYDLINFVTLGAGTGLSVRDFELSEGEDNVLLRTDLEKVGRAETLLHLIEHERHDIVEFSDEEHDFKRIKGIVARFTHKDKPSEPFYAIKAISQGGVLKGATSWEFRDGKFGAFTADVGLKMPTDNQVLIVGKDIFVFNQPKFEKLFNYEYKKQLLADKKVEEIMQHYKLSFPDGLDLQSLVRDRKKIVNKLQKMEIGGVTQDQAIDYADEMQLELMTDEANAIIIMDGTDLDTFVNLINEDYITSEITGKRYVITAKKP
ncbi:MAG TPA: Kiwa anti-phage protein KwaB-like domain-containing protein, partial [Candidatus Saccharimonadaceae bacterium]|nr:Kiwa anti-phage protein KwaB-like domain-containing protein [Candidatus Saccharimonadaceae bacterium]